MGINTGAEAGIYHANRLIPKGQRKLVHYNAVSEDEMPLIGICLERKGRKLFTEKNTTGGWQFLLWEYSDHRKR